MTSKWAWWRLKSPALPLFTQPFIRAQIKKISKLGVTGLCEGNSPVAGEFPTQRASDAESVSIWLRHHVYVIYVFISLGTMTDICVTEIWVTIGLGNVHVRRQAITWTNTDLLSIGPLKTNLNKNKIIYIPENAHENVVCKMAAILSRPQCVMEMYSFTSSVLGDA